MSNTDVRTFSLRVPSSPLTPRLANQGGEISFLAFLSKAEGPRLRSASSQDNTEGLREHPFNMKAATEFKAYNIHHSTCINTKVASMVGLGFVSDKVSKTLNPLCMVSFQDVVNDMAEDFQNTANGYMEVVRGEGGAVTGIYHAFSPEIYTIVEPNGFDFHYKQVSPSGSEERVFARFGDLEDFERRAQMTGSAVELGEQSKTTELIHFRDFAASSKWYGIPSWLAAVANIELVQCMTQHTFDFYLNRGVPEFMLFITGGMLTDDDWEAVKSHMQAQIGLGNSHKSMALNLANKDIVIQIEKLAMDVKNDTAFGDLNNSLAMNIVSGHQVPPLLAGIQIPGKLGATNELPNALMAFQILKIGPSQNNIQQVFGTTLGSPEAGLGLAEGDFKLKTILEEMDINAMATVGGMRETLPEAKASGRDLNDGLKT